MTLVALGAGAPLVGVAALLGIASGPDDPGASPARLSADLIDTHPGRPRDRDRDPHAGLVRDRSRAAHRPAHAPISVLLVSPAGQTDVVVANALRDGTYTVGADVSAFGPPRSTARTPGRTWLRLARRWIAAPTLAMFPTRAHYTSAIGRDQALRIDLARAAYEGCGWAAGQRRTCDRARRAVRHGGSRGARGDRPDADATAVVRLTFPRRPAPPTRSRCSAMISRGSPICRRSSSSPTRLARPQAPRGVATRDRTRHHARVAVARRLGGAPAPTLMMKKDRR